MSDCHGAECYHMFQLAAQILSAAKDEVMIDDYSLDHLTYSAVLALKAQMEGYKSYNGC